MPYEDVFLISYGLHSFVTHARSGGRRVFTIDGRRGRKMVRHATDLITETYDQESTIRVI